MRKYIEIFFAILTMLGVISCSEDLDISSEQGSFNLTVRTAALTTKAEIAGDDNLNENVIESLHYFLYPSGKTNENAVVQGVVRPTTAVQETLTIGVDIDETTLRDFLFSNNRRECDVYVIANLPDGVELPSTCSVDELKKIDISGSLTDTNPAIFKKQTSFVMDGLGKADLISLRKTLVARGDIEMDRVASKLSLSITISDSYTDGEGVVWTPDISSMTIKLSNCTNNATLNGTAADVSPALFSYSERESSSNQSQVTVTGKDGVYTRYHFNPFYSYPYAWDIRNEDELSFLVMLPWSDSNGHWQRCYYKVLLNTTELIRNTYYHINLHIGVLGSFSPTEAPVLFSELEYYVEDWKNGLADFTGGLQEEVVVLAAHYLVLDKNQWVMNNQTNMKIPYVSSDKCIIKNINITREDLGGSNDFNPAGVNSLTVELLSDPENPLNTYISIDHALINDLNDDNVDYIPYTITFTICHEDSPDKYTEDITVTQYPANYIVREQNSYYDSEDPTADKTGSVFVNGDGPATNGYGDFGGCYGIYGGETNSNPNRYIIKTSVLSTNDLIIGDPRVNEIDYLGDSDYEWSAEGKDMYSTSNRHLTNYYPTDRTTYTTDMISPEFMIASSYGVCQSENYQTMQRRCASYQEDGYPAGRWRMPTAAELEYITNLSAKKVIPKLFEDDNETYWCAHGSATINGTMVTIKETANGNHAVRCVYDTWYWDDRLEGNAREVFTWGDSPR